MSESRIIQQVLSHQLNNKMEKKSGILLIFGKFLWIKNLEEKKQNKNLCLRCTLKFKEETQEVKRQYILIHLNMKKNSTWTITFKDILMTFHRYIRL